MSSCCLLPLIAGSVLGQHGSQRSCWSQRTGPSRAMHGSGRVLLHVPVELRHVLIDSFLSRCLTPQSGCGQGRTQPERVWAKSCGPLAGKQIHHRVR